MSTYTSNGSDSDNIIAIFTFISQNIMTRNEGQMHIMHAI